MDLQEFLSTQNFQHTLRPYARTVSKVMTVIGMTAISALIVITTFITLLHMTLKCNNPTILDTAQLDTVLKKRDRQPCKAQHSNTEQPTGTQIQYKVVRGNFTKSYGLCDDLYRDQCVRSVAIVVIQPIIYEGKYVAP